MEVNQFACDPKGTSSSALFNLTEGTFTFLAGQTTHTGNMRLETPVGAMGIRGTAPHVAISDDSTVKFTTLVEGSPRFPRASDEFKMRCRRIVLQAKKQIGSNDC